MGYSSTQKGYKCFNHVTNKCVVSRYVHFEEETPFFKKDSTSCKGELLWDLFPLPIYTEFLHHDDSLKGNGSQEQEVMLETTTSTVSQPNSQGNGDLEATPQPFIYQPSQDVKRNPSRERKAPAKFVDYVTYASRHPISEAIIFVNCGWSLYQMDVKNAFLHGELHEEVYMQIPPCYSLAKDGMVCKLHKTIYGLKQSPRAWYAKLSSMLEREGFLKSNANSSLFVRNGTRGKLVVLIYVDDLIITGDNASEIGA
ncbi:uncharacterized protein [Malus domestica]|uniref:uncharacterized protein n=1 Tax=Malus domestica TaxID=3750 RepID=UPI0039755145